jgi:hypothetical protein
MENIDQIVKILESNEINMFPCLEEEVVLLEQAFGVRLTEAYRSFLLRLGKGADPFCRGSEWEYAKLFKLRKDFEGLLQENNKLHLIREEAFVFMMHQGYIGALFHVDEGSDPIVWQFTEGDDDTIVSTSKTVSAYMLEDAAHLNSNDWWKRDL